MPTTLTFERQKMSLEIWEKLKNHIMRQREKRKQEQEQDAEQERHRREQELKRKRDATTLEDIKDQLSKLDTRLSDLKKEKHELFLQLKKVLNEDEVRKKQKESEILAVHQAIHAQQQNNKYNPFLMNSNYLNNSRIPPNQISLQQQQQLQQQLLSKQSPITSGTSLSTPANYINTVITQSSSMPTHQQQPQQMTNKRSAGVKRPLERSSPQPNVPYTGILPIYKTSMSFTPTVPRIATTSQVFYPPNRHLSIPVSQPSISSGQINFDSKNNPYQFLPGVIPGVDTSSHDQVTAAAVNAVNSGQLSSQQLSQLHQQQQDFYQQQLRGLAAGLQPSLMSIQNNQLKQGGITAGFPVNRPGMPSNTTGQANNNQIPGRQFPNRFIY